VIFFTFYSFLTSVALLGFGVYVGFLGAFFKDFKKVVAHSTTSQLVLIGLIRFFGLSEAALIYILVHARFKATIFIFCGMRIHGVETQLKGSGLMQIFWGGVSFLVVMISGFPFLVVANIKDCMVGCGGFLIFTFFNFFALGTLCYSLGLGRFFGGFASISVRFFGVLVFATFFALYSRIGCLSAFFGGSFLGRSFLLWWALLMFFVSSKCARVRE
jgi:NADH:ubiquinone oxidoreductase subunit 5 (subunit L)/multisubunit Na+/H+ antiporter MnhA subunit